MIITRYCAVRSAIPIVATATAIMTVALAGCASSSNLSRPGQVTAISHVDQGTIRGQAILSGRVPFAGHSFKVGAIADGKIMQTADIPRTGGSFMLHVPAGNYRLSLLVSDVPVADSSVGCSTNVTSVAGVTVPASLQCTWH